MEHENAFACSVVIPTLDAGDTIAALIAALRRQTVQPEAILVVDSQSQDRTADIARAAGADVRIIERAAFDHGGTRDWALRQTRTPFVVFMTQDALPAGEDSLERLLAPMKGDARIAAVGARQIAFPSAPRYEQLVREHNYPPQSRTWGAEQVAELGIRAFLLSNVCAAYRRSAYEAAGGFDHPILTNEDMLMTQKLLDRGFLVHYAADACVYHSHDFTLGQQFRRNYIIGRTLRRYRHRFANAQEFSTGRQLAQCVLTTLLRERRFMACARFSADCLARLLGNRLGRRDEARAEGRGLHNK